MNVCFMGSMHFAVPILEGLHQKHNVLLVVTQPDRPVGRKRVITPTPVKEKAIELGLELFQPERIKWDHDPIMALDVDFIIVAAYGQMIPEDILNHGRYRAINVHASLLPKYRGGSPMHRAIQYGDDVTGVTIMYMAKKMDAGDLLAQRSVPIEATDNVGTLEEKLSLLGRDLLLETMTNIDRITPVKQDESQVTFARNIQPEEEVIHFTDSAQHIHNHVRAFYPWPLTYLWVDGKKVKVYETSWTEKTHSKTPGEIVAIDTDGVHIQTKEGTLVLKDVQLQGKKRMLINDFMNGAGRSLFVIGKILE